MLTLKQDNFVLAYIETGNASEAYRRAYDTSKMNENSVNRKAKELLDNVKITARIAELRKPVVEQVQITLKSHLDKLAELRDKAEYDAKWQAAIQAEVARGKASGLYVDRVEQTGPNGGAQQHEHHVTLTISRMAQLKAKTSNTKALTKQ